ncbi:MAG TPA: hypothetical protein VKA31_09635 [Mariprofundaceae bacterium]|nr:hypothetical protein [Mariprofundaceae bacterium]
MKLMRIALVSGMLGISGCAVVPMIAAIPSALVEPLFGQFGSEVRSLPISMRKTLVATQRSLKDMKFDLDILEILDNGYNIRFASGPLAGGIELRSQTEKLTSISVQVRAKTREDSVEKAVLRQIEENASKVSRREHFDFRSYDDLRKKPDVKSKQIGWYRPGAQLAVTKVYKKPEWLKLKLPSGAHAFLKGSIEHK